LISSKALINMTDCSSQSQLKSQGYVYITGTATEPLNLEMNSKGVAKWKVPSPNEEYTLEGSASGYLNNSVSVFIDKENSKNITLSVCLTACPSGGCPQIIKVNVFGCQDENRLNVSSTLTWHQDSSPNFGHLTIEEGSGLWSLGDPPQTLSSFQYTLNAQGYVVNYLQSITMGPTTSNITMCIYWLQNILVDVRDQRNATINFGGPIEITWSTNCGNLCLIDCQSVGCPQGGSMQWNGPSYLPYTSYYTFDFHLSGWQSAMYMDTGLNYAVYIGPQTSSIILYINNINSSS